MADTLESLEIEVKHSSTGAAGELEKVAEAIGKISRALSNSLLNRLEKLAATLDKVGSPLTINDIHDSTFNKTTQTVRQGAAVKKDQFATPVSEDMANQIAQADKLQIELHKIAEAEKEFDRAVRAGEAEKAWKAREAALNAAARAMKLVNKEAKQAEKEAQAGEMQTGPDALPNGAQALLPGMAETSKLADEASTSVGALSAEMQGLIMNADGIAILQHKLEGLKAALQQAFESGDAEKAYAIQEQILRVQSALDKATNSTKDMTRSVKELSRASNKSKGPLKNFIDSLKRIAFYRFIRAIIKSITQAFQEGLKNAYAFSQGLETEGHRFASALDSMKSAGAKMKNQLGSAFISLLAAIAPVVNQIIALVVRVADALSQLFAAFTGGTYLKAKDTFQSWGDTAEAGAAATKEWKNQLMGFDEINRLEAPSDSGGGAGGGGIGDLFEEAQIGEKYLAFAEKVKAFLEWCKEHLDLIQGIVIAIGAAFLLWKIADIASDIMKVATAIGITGVAVGLLVGGFVALGIGMADWIRTGELSTDAFWLVAGGIMAVAAGISLLTGSWIPLLIGTIVAFVIGVVTQFDKIKAKLQEWRNASKEAWGNGKLDASDFLYVFTTICLGIIEVIEWVINAVKRLIEWFGTLREKWAGARESISEAQAMANTEAGHFGVFASGGYPMEGEVFIAREAGPEMVGTIGGRTAVANNDQITTAIAGAVYNAIVSANGSSGGGVKTAILNVDGKEFCRATFRDSQAVAREHGVSLIVR